MTKILLTTQFFPYSKDSEVFLLSEIRNLPKDIELLIIPESVKTNKIIDESLLNLTNVNIVDKEIRKTKMLKFYYAVKALFSIMFWEELLNIIKSRKRILQKTKKMLYASIVSDIYYKKLSMFQVKVDVIYSYWLNNYVLGLIKYGKKNGIKVVSRAHGHDLYNEATTLNYHPFRKRILESLDYCFPVSNIGLDYLKQRYISNFKVFYLGTNDLGLNPNNNHNQYVHFVSCSAVIPLKRVDLIYHILSGISNYKVKWTHFGDGADFNLLQSKVSNSNIEVVLMGHVDTKTIYDYYKRHSIDCFINLSTTEGIPVSIMEAISFGIPIIATNVGGVNEILTNNDNGFLIDEIYNTNAIQMTVNKFVNLTIKEQSLMRLKSREIWEEKFNAVKNYSDFYEYIKKSKEDIL